MNRQYIYRWKKRYDGTLQSLVDKSHRPQHHPNQHTEAELKLIADMRKRNANTGLVVFWVKLRQRGYTRSITGLYRVMKKMGLKAEKLPNLIVAGRLGLYRYWDMDGAIAAALKFFDS